MMPHRRFSVLALALVTLFVFSAPPLNAKIMAYGASEVRADAGAPVRAFLAYFTTSRAGTKAEEIAITIDWGDGTVSDGSCVDDRNGRFWVYGDHSYAASGVYNVKVKIYDPIQGFGTTDLRPGVM
ncbi:MAG: hypothetical protein ACHQPI_00640 [Thermoanaerobaculia bacterium]